jgi:hypothetical protein
MRTYTSILFGLAALAAASGCSSRGDAPALGKVDEDAKVNIPVPPADGPKLVAIRAHVAVVDRPGDKGKPIGELGLGAVVVRSSEPFSRVGCKKGWFAIRPKGLVCADDVALHTSLAVAVPGAADLAHSLPYRYGRARTEGVPIYARIPTADEQAAAEPDLFKHLKQGEDRDPLGAGANDVPLDTKNAPAGPAVLLPTGEGIVDGKRTTASFFGFPHEATPPIGDASAEIKNALLRKGSGVAISASFTVDGAAAARRFGVLPDGRLVPTDRLKASLGTTWHGVDLDQVGLPVAFVHKLGVHTYTLDKGKAMKHDEELERRASVPLTGRFRTVEGVRFEESRSGEWLRSQDLVVIVKRTKMPDFASGNQKWVDVSIANQTLTAYEGKKAIYATLVSTGRDVLKDGANVAATPRGVFKVKRKAITTAVDAREVQGFEVLDAPWALELDATSQGTSLVGMYWGDGLGEASTFHDIALAPIDAHRLWSWSDPPLPEGWSAVTDDAQTTIVNVRP